MRILIYHGKHGKDYYLVDTPERLEAAMRQLFQQLDDCGCYEDDEQDVAEARSGNIKAITWVLKRHAGYEYEEWEIIEAIDPCTP